MLGKKSGESFDIRERRMGKVAEKQNLEKRKQVKDRHYHIVDDEDDSEDYEFFMKGKKNG